jgi:hypothetical protein
MTTKISQNEISSISSSHVTTALGFTPISSSGTVFSSTLGLGLSSTNRLNFTYDGTSGIATVGPNSTGGSTYLTLGTSNAGTYAERMRIDNAGNVGLGTTAPIAKLDVGGALTDTLSATYGGTIRVNSATQTTVQAIGGIELPIAADGYGYKIQQLSAGGSALAFALRNGSATWSEVLRINVSGNVGIGTSSPAQKLSVSGNVVFNGGAGNTLELNKTAGAALYFSYAGPLSDALLQGTGSGGLQIYTGNTLVERMRIDSSGNVKLSTGGTVIQNSSGRPILNQSGSILQVVSTYTNTVTSTTSTSRNGASTGLSVSITPSSTSSKILVIWQVDGQSTGGQIYFNVLRNAATELLSGSGGSVGSTGANKNNSYIDQMQKGTSGTFLDSPATTSATTYDVYFWVTSGTGYTNRSNYNPDNSVSTSTLTIMEISG